MWTKLLGLLSLPADNRLERAVKNLEAFNVDFPRGKGFTHTHASRGDLVADSARTVVEAFFVAHAIKTRPRARHLFTPKHLKAFLEGADVESPESPSDARSIQFEAVVLAQFFLSGVSVEREEPDLTFFYHNFTVGLAIKRVRTRNPSAFDKRLDEGARQLARKSLSGFVAVSMDPWLADLDVGSDPNRIGEAFVRDVGAAYERLGTVENKLHVLGVIATACWMKWHFETDPPQFDWKTPFQVRGFKSGPNADVEERQLIEFFDGMMTRWVNALEEIGKHLASS